jgi:glycosyltransferase involved in cell wall biosynthesis
VIIAHVIAGLEDGGAEACLYRLCCGDHRNKHLVVSLTSRGKYGRLLREAHIPVVSLNLPRGRLSFSAITTLVKTLKSWKPDVVQTWMYHANLVGGCVARVAGVKSIVWCVHHGAPTPESTKWLTRLIARGSGVLSASIPLKVVFCAHSSAKIHQQIGYSVEKTCVIGNGYDLTQFTPDLSSRSKVRRDIGMPENMVLLGMVARFDPAKDHRTLMGSLRLLRERGVTFECLLVGSGMDSGNRAVTSLVDEYGLNSRIHLLGPRRNIADLMNAIDIHVLSSCVEAFPNVLAEAMACGTPCVATEVGDSSYILGETGWLVARKDPHALADALQDAIQALATPLWSDRQAAARRRIISKFGVASMVSQYNELWDEMAGGAAGAVLKT